MLSIAEIGKRLMQSALDLASTDTRVIIVDDAIEPNGYPESDLIPKGLAARELQ